ncbi:MAG TPA: hypothetical protein VF646_12580, partial [Cytophagales bacterium]
MMKAKNAYQPFDIRYSWFNIRHFFSGFSSHPSLVSTAKGKGQKAAYSPPHVLCAPHKTKGRPYIRSRPFAVWMGL